MKISDRLDIAMNIAGFKSQAELSRASGVSESTLARILKGVVTPSVEVLQALGKTLNVSLDWIVNGKSTEPHIEAGLYLSYITLEELQMITQFREANSMGKTLIKTACDNAPKSDLPPTTPIDKC